MGQGPRANSVPTVQQPGAPLAAGQDASASARTTPGDAGVPLFKLQGRREKGTQREDRLWTCECPKS